MEENIAQPTTQPDMFQPTNDLKALPKDPEEPAAKTPTPMEWSSLPVSHETKDSSLLASSIQQGQETLVNNTPATPVSERVKKNRPNSREEQSAPDFKENIILPILDLVAEVEPKTLFFIVTDLRTRTMAGIKKETFGELLKTAEMPVLLQKELHHLGCSTALEGACDKTCWEQCLDKVLPDSAGIQRKKTNKSHRVQPPSTTQREGPHCLP